ncbi:MAG TPA: YafY family protein [Ktedonobacteraceae bacterium]|nr:YafY family protein [Ktedonobacteraceae bacterium]
MNRTDRLLAIVLELQGKGHQRAEDLAATFETSKRTIYRDMLALGEAGVPIVSMPGRGYSLMQGYFLPPLSFTTDEATMLLLGSDFMAQNFDAQYREAAQSASRKIEGALSEKLRDEVRYLQSSIRFVAASPQTPENARRIALLQQLRRAIIQHTTVRFTYHARHSQDGKSEQTRREADPYGLIHFPAGWHMTGYCHLRQGIRNFRLDRIDDLELLPATFQRPANFVMRRDRESDREIVVRVLFDHDIARWVQEARSYYVVAEEETPDGLLVTLTIRQESEILHWLLSWGRHARVLEPESLRERLAEEAEGMVTQYKGRVARLQT